MLLHGFDKLFGRRVHAQVIDLESGALQHDHAHVLADVVDVALNGADHVAAHRLGAGLRDQRPEDDQRALHRASGDEHLGDEEVAFLETAPDLLEGRDEGLEQDVHGVHAEAERLFRQRFDLGRVAVERVLEQLGADLVFPAHVLRIAQLMLRTQQFTWRSGCPQR